MGRGRFSFSLLLASLLLTVCPTALYSLTLSRPRTGGMSAPIGWFRPDPYMSSRPQPADGWDTPIPFVCSQCPFTHAEHVPCPPICTSAFNCRYKIPSTDNRVCEECALIAWRATGFPSPSSQSSILQQISDVLDALFRPSSSIISKTF